MTQSAEAIGANGGDLPGQGNHWSPEEKRHWGEVAARGKFGMIDRGVAPTGFRVMELVPIIPQPEAVPEPAEAAEATGQLADAQILTGGHVQKRIF